MFLDLNRSAERIERRSRDERVCSKCDGTLAMLDNAFSLGVDDAYQHGNAMVNDAYSLAHNLVATLVSGENHLTGRTQEEESVHTRIKHVVDYALERRNVELVIGSVGHHYRRHDTGKLEFSHGFLSFHLLLINDRNSISNALMRS